MSFTVSDIQKDVFDVWGRPAKSDLPDRLIVSVVNRKVNRLLLSLQLSDKNYLAVISDPIAFDAGERTRLIDDLDDLSSIVRVESRAVGGDDDSWSEEIIRDFGSFNDSESSVDNIVAFYGNDDTLTMAVNRDVTDTEFRVLYETGGISLQDVNAAVPALQDFFKSTIFYGVAAECGMALDNLNAEGEKSRDKKVAYFIQQESQSLNDFQKWLLNDPGQAVEYRQAFNSDRPFSGTSRMIPNRGYISRF